MGPVSCKGKTLIALTKQKQGTFSTTCSFSNSVIIYQVETKKITAAKEVWIPGLNKHRF